MMIDDFFQWATAFALQESVWKFGSMLMTSTLTSKALALTSETAVLASKSRTK